jgi:hypothetical protein
LFKASLSAAEKWRSVLQIPIPIACLQKSFVVSVKTPHVASRSALMVLKIELERDKYGFGKNL